MQKVKVELYHDNFQNYKRYGIPSKAQLVIADIPYNIGENAYGSSPMWYKGGDNANGDSKFAKKAFFRTDGNFNIAEYFNFCSRLLKKEPKERNQAPAMIVFCSYQQIPLVVGYGERNGFMKSYPLYFIKNYSAQVLKANMRIVGATEMAIVLFRGKLPKFRNVDAAGLAQQQLGNSTSLAGNLGNLYNTQYAQLNGALGQQGALAQQQLANTAAGTQANAGLYSALMNSAGTPLTLSAAAQEAAQQPAINLWNMSLGLNGANASALAGVAGKGTSSQTTTQSGGGGFLGGLFGGALTGAANAYGGLWCFPPETMVRMADGSEKKIAHIEVGERVMGIGKDGKECPATVMHKLDDHADMVYNVCCKNGHAMTTLSQPLMKDDGSFVLVRDLRIGDVLKGGGMLIGIIEAGDRPLCDLQTDGENNYIADGFVAKGGDPAIWG